MKKFSRLVVILVFSISTLVVPFMAPTTVGAITQPGYNGKISFLSTRDGDQEVYVMDADGSNQTNLTNASSNEYQSEHSPDGSKIAFFSNRDGNYEIYVMDADGSNLVRLTNAPGDDRDLKWSPDSSKIVFTSGRNGTSEVYVMDADGSNQTNLTNYIGYDNNPTWSPDGTKIIFTSNRGATGLDVYKMNTDGSGLTNLTSSPGNDWNPVFSPDGTKIFSESDRVGNRELFMMNVDGSNPVRITSTPSHEELGYTLSFSPAGDRMAFSRMNLDWDASTLVIMNTDGSGEQQYDLSAQGVVLIDEITWSPNGLQLLLTGYSDGSWSEYDLYVINGDGTGLQQLTYDGVSGYSDTWQTIYNTEPIAITDSFATSYNSASIIDVLANDIDEETLLGANLSIAAQPTQGTASIIDGKVRYAPNPGFQGSDSLTYQICDSFMLDQLCSTSTVNVTVSAPVPPSIIITNVNGEAYNPSTDHYETSNLRPTFSGTATPGAEVTVEIHSDPVILTTTVDGNGNWSVTPTFDLPSGEHIVYISATLNGLTTELDAFGLSIGGLANTGVSLWKMVVISSVATVLGVILLTARLKESIIS